MEHTDKLTADDYTTIGLIADRAVIMARKQGFDYRKQDAFMDLVHVHKVCPLRLDELLHADPFNFSHDIAGILNHFNRRTLQLEDCFIPRYAKPSNRTKPNR